MTIELSNYKLCTLENLLAKATEDNRYPTHLIKKIAKARNKINKLGHSKNLDLLIKDLGFTSWNHYAATEHYTQSGDN